MRQPEEQPWDQDYYETGNTKPPKDHTLLLVVLLCILVLYLGVSTVKDNLGKRMQNSIPTETTVAVVKETVPFSAYVETEATESEDSDSITAQKITLEDFEMVIESTPESVPNILQEGSLPLQEIYKKTIDSVVSISCKGKESSSSGTGVILSQDGYIVTNYHVVESGRQYSVMLNDESVYDAVLVGGDRVADLAVLKIDAVGLHVAEFGDSDRLQVGDSVVAIGDPLGVELRGTMTNGIISAINRDITIDGRKMTLIQTNAALNSGNSGGPLINCYGQVIGINTMKMGNKLSSTTVEGLGFAIPISTVRSVVEELIMQGYVSGRPSLGFSYEAVTSFYQLYYGLPSGVFVVDLEEGCNAESAGLKESDLILYFDGQRVSSEDDITSLLYAHDVGDTISVVVYRRNAQVTIEFELQEATG